MYMREELIAAYPDVESPGHLSLLSDRFEPDATPSLTNYTRDSRKREPDGTRRVVVLDVTAVPPLEIQPGTQPWYAVHIWQDDGADDAAVT